MEDNQSNNQKTALAIEVEKMIERVRIALPNTDPNNFLSQLQTIDPVDNSQTPIPGNSNTSALRAEASKAVVNQAKEVLDELQTVVIENPVLIK